MAVTLLHDLSFAAHRRAGRDTLVFRHRLEETGLFSDLNVGRLIDETPRGAIAVRTLGYSGPEPWISGAPGRLSGAELLDAARRGRLQIALPGTVDIRFGRVFSRLMDEFAWTAGLKSVEPSIRILVTSPGLATAFHVDSGEALRFLVRGTETLQVQSHLASRLGEHRLEAILRAQAPADLPGDAELTDGATPLTLKAGDAAWTPLHAPHRMLNGRDLNVSALVTFDSPRARRANGVVYTNGVLRRRLGLHPDSSRTPGLLQPAYHAAAQVLQGLARQAVAVDRADPPRFVVDLDAPGCIRWRGPQAPAHAA